MALEDIPDQELLGILPTFAGKRPKVGAYKFHRDIFHLPAQPPCRISIRRKQIIKRRQGKGEEGRGKEKKGKGEIVESIGNQVVRARTAILCPFSNSTHQVVQCPPE